MKQMLSAVSIFFALLIVALLYLAILVAPIVLIYINFGDVAILFFIVWIPIVIMSTWLSAEYYTESVQ
jgi:hypothetical protein